MFASRTSGTTEVHTPLADIVHPCVKKHCTTENADDNTRHAAKHRIALVEQQARIATAILLSATDVAMTARTTLNSNRTMAYPRTWCTTQAVRTRRQSLSRSGQCKVDYPARAGNARLAASLQVCCSAKTSASRLQPRPKHLMPLPSRAPLVTIEPLGRVFEAPSSLTLLEAAGFANVRLPKSCRNGTCRTCMCRLVSGRVFYRIEWPGLTKEEMAEGLVLPCVAVAETDLVLDVPGAEII